MEQNYTAQDIQVLGELEAVQRRPGMYIGSVDQKGLHHLIHEIVDNSIDEAMAGYCNHIEIIIHEDHKVTVTDNGRGIPTELHPSTGVSALETVMTTLHSGAKFGGNSYKVCGGLHGVGAAVVNALSSWFRVDVRRDGKLYRQEYENGIPLSPVSVSGDAEGNGTSTTFLPNEEIFGKIDYDFDSLAQFLREMAYLNKGLEISVQDECQDDVLTFYFEGGIASFIRHLNRKRNKLHPRPIYISKMVNSTVIEAAIQYHEGFAESTFSFANCINTSDGGSHLTGFRTGLTRALNEYARKYKLLKDNEPNFSGDDVREGLTAIISIKLTAPQFEGQTKKRLGNPEVKNQVEAVVTERLLAYLEEHPQEAKRILDKCLTTARAREAAKKARELVLRKTTIDSDTLPGKLADCSEKAPAQRELYIVEGESAGGSAKQGRERQFQAILPLRGKILNVEKAAPNKMLSHEEIRAIIAALGVGVGSELNMERLRYQRVIIMTDADVDGSHIKTLLLTFFFRYMTGLIEGGHLYIAQPPLYRLKKGKEHFWVYSDGEKEELASKLGDKNIELQRYKGLGEMNPEQLWESTMNPEKRMILQVSIEDAMKANQIVEMLMGDAVPPRKAFIQAHAKRVRNLDV
jgi:DNA gyrase subunit B